MKIPATTQPRFITRPEVERRTRYGRERIRQLEALGQFPQRIRLSSRRNVWVEAEVDKWIAARIAGRAGGAA